MIRRTSFSLAAAALAVAGGLAFAQPVQAQEQLVNVNNQAGTQLNADTAVNPVDGSYVVVYQSGTGESADIYLRRYNSLGQPLDANPILVNTNTTGQQSRPDVAVAENGDIIVVFESRDDGTGSDYDVIAQRYNAAGTPLGGNFQVNTTQAGEQSDPSVASDAAGNFIVIYEDLQAGGDYDLLGRTFLANGTAGTEQVILDKAGDQITPDVQVNDAGTSAVVVYQDSNLDGSGFGVAAQIIPTTLSTNTVGTPGAQIQVNDTPTSGNQDEPSVDMDGTGNFVVVFESGSDGAADIYARTFNAAGVPQSGAFLVNSGSTTGDQFAPDVAIADSSPGTNFTVVFVGNQTGSNEIYAKTYDFATRTSANGIFQTNTATAGSQTNPAIDADNVGNYVIAFEGPDAENSGIYVNRFAQQTGAVVPVGTVFPGAVAGNQCPEANFTVTQGPSTTPGQTQVTVNASSSTDPDNGPQALSFIYEVYNANNVLVQQVGPTNTSTQQFNLAPGTYTFVVRVSDGDNTCDNTEGPDREQQQIVVNQFPSNQCPTASFFTTQSPSTQPGQTRLTINASGSNDPNNGPQALTYTYEVRNSNNVLVASNTSTNSTQQFDLAPGSYTVTVRVSDGDTLCDTTQGSDVSTQPVFIEQISTFNSSVNASGYVVPDEGGKKVQLSFYGAFNKNGLGGGLSLKDPRTGYSFKSTQITSIVVNGNTATITGFGTSNGPEGTNENVAFTATGIDINPTFVGRGDRVEVETEDGYFLSGVYNTGDVKVSGGQQTLDTARTR